VLGVTQQDISSWLVAANPSIPVADVFRNFVVWEIFVNKSLRVLGCSSSSSSSSDPLMMPSWVPNFAGLDRQPGLLRLQHRVAFQAGGHTSLQARLSSDEKVLYLLGRAVDVLHTVGQQQQQASHVTENNCSNTSSNDDALYVPAREQERSEGAERGMSWHLALRSRAAVVVEALGIWKAACRRLASSEAPLAVKSRPSLLGLELEDEDEDEVLVDTSSTIRTTSTTSSRTTGWGSFWRALICDSTDLGRPAPESYELPVLAYIRIVADAMSVSDAFVEQWLKQAQRADRSITVASASRRFAGTDQGFAGWVPQDARAGDVVAVLYGSRVPFVLRRVEDGKYRLVGECYIHGLMAGEATTIMAPWDGVDGGEAEFALV
jgi:hypothetical protein